MYIKLQKRLKHSKKVSVVLVKLKYSVTPKMNMYLITHGSYCTFYLKHSAIGCIIVCLMILCELIPLNT